jgi:hypothetical protein
MAEARYTIHIEGKDGLTRSIVVVATSEEEARSKAELQGRVVQVDQVQEIPSGE